MRIIVDNQGREFQSLHKAFDANDLQWGGRYHKILKKNGKVTSHGVTFTLMDDGKPVAPPEEKAEVVKIVTDPLFEKLKERYSMDELKMLSEGKGIEKTRIPYPTIRLYGKHHKFVVISDTHIGSIYSPEEWHEEVAKVVNQPDIEGVLHCGDLVDGFKISRAGTQVYELSEVGFERQRAKSIELMRIYEKPIYIISGNHDMYFSEFAGANLVKSVADALPNMEYIGHDQADIFVDDCKIRLFHGGDGSSYALSYRLQKLIESYTGGDKPNILLAGHVHKFCYLFERNIHAVSVPTLQSQTNFMRSKKLAAHTGFLVIEFDTVDGNVVNFQVKLYPFYA